MIDFKSFNFASKKVVMRVDFNVPLNDAFEITDDTRIVSSLPTIKKILGEGGSIVLMSHLGRPKAGPNPKYSLSHLMPHLQSLLSDIKISFVDDCISEKAFDLSSSLISGEILLLENLRFYPEEEKGDVDFAKKLSRHGDIYINDAYGTAHRAHASTAVIAQFFNTDHKGFGLLMNAEVENGLKLLNSSVKPVTAIVGGAKVSDKIKLLENLISKMDNVLIGGGMAYTFIKAKGGEIGKSLCELEYLSLALEILEKAEARGCKVYLPEDSVVADAFSKDANHKIVASDAISADWMGLDIGPNAIKVYNEVISNSATILWNGPMGVFEFEAFSNGTFSVAKAVASATKEGAFSLIGGGDSVSAIHQCGLEHEVSFVSTGGGAMLEMLEGKTLPGIAAIQN